MSPIVSIEYWVLITIFVLSTTVFVSWYTTSTLHRVWRVIILISRFLGVCGILLLMLNPGDKRERFEPLDSSWAVMVDQSASMQFRDVRSESRWTSALEIVAEVLKLSENKEKVHLYTFSDSVRDVTFEELASDQPDGKDTRIVESGQTMLMREKSRGSNLNGILLLSDGRQPVHGPSDAFALKAASQEIPVYPVVLGGEVPSRDLELYMPRQKYVSFIGQPVTLAGSLINKRLGPVSAEIVLGDSEGKRLEKTTVLANDGDEISFRFDVTRDKPGYYEYIIETDVREGESDRANNTAGLGVFVLSDRLNVLLLEGQPYWDTKFLSHLLRAQANISMTAIFRVAEDKFFKVSTDADMTSSKTDVFPETDEELAAYDLVVLGRGTEFFIDEVRAGRLADFVKTRGGCLFFARGKSYEGTYSFLKDLEPVTWGEVIRSDFTLNPLLAGEQVGLFGGLLPDRGDRLWDDLPVLTRGHSCKQLKSFASVLARGVPVSSSDEPFPLLVSKRFGDGLVLMVNGDGLWRWGFSPDATGNGELYQNLWIQLFQWAVSFAEFNPGSDYLIRTDHNRSRINEPLRIRVRARAHVKTEDIVVRIYDGGKEISTMALAEDLLQKGGWSGLVTFSAPGIYRLAIETPDGKNLGAQTSVQIHPTPGETGDLSADALFLNDIAEKSGGRVITGKELPELVRHLEAPKATMRKGDVTWETSWDKAFVCILIMMFFSVEWYVRRRQGLH